jgi:Ran GTPase-activating protein (RanGAP) involved in mRNA processing and transport
MLVDMLAIEGQTLATLKLTGCGLQESAVPLLARMLAQSKSLREVHLTSNGLGPACGEAFGAALRESRTLHTLDLRGSLRSLRLTKESR